jgi:hypothetical protein
LSGATRLGRPTRYRRREYSPSIMGSLSAQPRFRCRGSPARFVPVHKPPQPAPSGNRRGIWGSSASRVVREEGGERRGAAVLGGGRRNSGACGAQKVSTLYPIPTHWIFWSRGGFSPKACFLAAHLRARRVLGTHARMAIVPGTTFAVRARGALVGGRAPPCQ